MRNIRARARLALVPAFGVLMLAGSVFQAGVASAATYSGTWSLFAVAAPVTYDTPMHTTNSTHEVSTCVSVTKYSGGFSDWSVELIWWDGGQNKVLWHSGDYLGIARVCSPIEYPGGNDKVYTHIIIFPQSGISVQDSGNWSIDTY